MRISKLLDFLFPPQCLICAGAVGAQGSLCGECWGKIRFISPPYCAVCGLAFDFAATDGALCGECLNAPPPFTRARAVFRYDEHSRALVTQLKYADQTHMARGFGAWLTTAGNELIHSSDMIVPVPLYYWRFVGRRYNQAALLAYALSGQCGLPVLPDGLRRVRPTLPQASLSRKERLSNVKNAFAVRKPQAVAGKRVLLVDDVQTTSATISECTRALLRGGAANVQVLTLSRKW
ncbi:MAG: ComF family protein [Rickettsiales bacterium]|nr:ComF family protein [Rickettsiales bacterium]